jgi:hypothetical protein
MKIYITVILILLVVLLLIRAVKKNRNKEESKLSVYEHPSTFKKPDIEMVSKPPVQNEKTEQNFVLKTPDNKTDQ